LWRRWAKTKLESSRSILTRIFTEYYHGAAHARDDGGPVAYITAFTPVEILRAMGVRCLYPESYAVVCAASNHNRDLIQASGLEAFSQDLCSYSLLSFGAEHYAQLPFRGLPEPDLLIGTNNQCGTTMLWFQLWAQKKRIPLFIIDYPAAANGQASLVRYIVRQYETLAEFVKKHTGHDLNTSILREQVAHSKKACHLWKNVHALNKTRPAGIAAHKIVDALFPIVVAKGTQPACDYYEALLGESSQKAEHDTAGTARLLWHGYPMWFLPKKFPRGCDDGMQVVLNDYTLWWSLNYPESRDVMEVLAVAYSDTYLNRPIRRKVDEVTALIEEYSIDGVVCHVNRSCRRALADIDPLRERLRQLSIPSVIIESDMANPSFYSDAQVQLRTESLRDTLRVRRPVACGSVCD
jgi:benzoyl-CoA reductase/2-hydroxyglutaryl-CoA dehydratase subunit BcrC/BadD/HgdB